MHTRTQPEIWDRRRRQIRVLGRAWVGVGVAFGILVLIPLAILGIAGLQVSSGSPDGPLLGGIALLLGLVGVGVSTPFITIGIALCRLRTGARMPAIVFSLLCLLAILSGGLNGGFGVYTLGLPVTLVSLLLLLPRDAQRALGWQDGAGHESAPGAAARPMARRPDASGTA